MGGSSPLLLVDLHNNNNNFYSLAENKVVSLGGGDDGGDPMAAAVIVGSSHGWLALMTQGSLDLYLWNPISRRRIDLPSIHNLPIPTNNLEGGFGCVVKLILSSSSPGDADCRAVLSYYIKRLAFCCPGHSTDWITIGARYLPDGSPRVYTDFAFSTRRNRLFCITYWDLELECWDLKDPFSPKIDEPKLEDDDDEEPELEDNDPDHNESDDEELEDDDESDHDESDHDELEDDNESDHDESEDDDESELGDRYGPYSYLVVAEQDHSNQVQLFMVVRNIHLGELVFRGNWKNLKTDPNKTLDFNVYKIVRGDGGENVKYVYVESLGGLSLFVGINQCFALSSAEFPELKPDSIYFADAPELRPRINRWWSSGYGFGRYDIGIFDYVNKVFYPCYCPLIPDEPEEEDGGDEEDDEEDEEDDGDEEDDEEDDGDEEDDENLPLIVWFTPSS